MNLRSIPMMVVLLTGLFYDTACNARQPIPPLKVLTFTMKWPILTPVQSSQLKQDLETGTKALTDAQLGRLTCDFVNDASISSSPIVSLNGNIGDPQVNFNYFQSTLIRAQNLGSCRPGTNEIPTEINIESDRGLVIGQVSKGGNMELAFGNDRFTADYREFTLTEVDAARRTAVARFQMMARNRANPQDTRVLIVVDGAIATPF